MKKVSRFVSVILASSLCVSVFAGCNSSSTTLSTAASTTAAASSMSGTSTSSEAGSSSSGSTSSESAPQITLQNKHQGYYVGFSNFSIGNSFRVQMEAEFKSYADKLVSEGILSKYTMVNSNGDVSKQISDVKDLITKGVKAICITSASPTALVNVCEQAEASGIKVVSFNETINSTKVTAVINQNEYERGVLMAKWLAQKLNGSGNVICLNGTSGTATDNQRSKGYKDVFKDYPKIKVLNEEACNWDYAAAKKAVEDMLSAYPQIDGVFSQGGAMTQAAIDAFVAAGRKLVPMTGEDNNGFLKEWKKYSSQGLSSFAPTTPTYISAYALQVAVSTLDGNKLPQKIQLPLNPITQDTLDKHVREDLPDSYYATNWLTPDAISKLFAKSSSK